MTWHSCWYSSIWPLIHFSLSVKSCLNPFLELTSTKQCGLSFLLKETTVVFDVLQVLLNEEADYDNCILPTVRMNISRMWKVNLRSYPPVRMYISRMWKVNLRSYPPVRMYISRMWNANLKSCYYSHSSCSIFFFYLILDYNRNIQGCCHVPFKFNTNDCAT